MFKSSMKKVITYFVFGILFFIPNFVSAYDNNITHPGIADLAVELYNETHEIKITPDQANWIRQGAVEEDYPVRYLNHFYDPINGNGFSEYKITMTSAKDWVNSPIIQSIFGLGDKTWGTGLEYYSKNKEKEAFLNLGHAIHLISDMSVPAHTRDSAHPLDPYESFVKNNWDKIAKDLKYDFIKVENLDQAFYDLAKYTNANFYSNRTIESYEYERIEVIDQFKIEDKKELMISEDYFGKRINLFIKSGDIYWDYQNFETIKTTGHYYVLSSHAQHLIPLAVNYSAGLIDLFIKQGEEEKSRKKSLIEKIALSTEKFITSNTKSILYFFNKGIKDIAHLAEDDFEKQKEGNDYGEYIQAEELNELINIAKKKNKIRIAKLPKLNSDILKEELKNSARFEMEVKKEGTTARQVLEKKDSFDPIKLVYDDIIDNINIFNSSTTISEAIIPTSTIDGIGGFPIIIPTSTYIIPTTTPIPSVFTPFFGGGGYSAPVEEVVVEEIIPEIKPVPLSTPILDDIFAEIMYTTTATSTIFGTCSDDTKSIAVFKEIASIQATSSIQVATTTLLSYFDLPELIISTTTTSTSALTSTSTVSVATTTTSTVQNKEFSFAVPLTIGDNIFSFQAISNSDSYTTSTISSSTQIILDMTAPTSTILTVTTTNISDTETLISIDFSAVDSISKYIHFELEYTTSTNSSFVPTTTDWKTLLSDKFKVVSSTAGGETSITHSLTDSGIYYYFRIQARDDAQNKSEWVQELGIRARASHINQIQPIYNTSSTVGVSTNKGVSWINWTGLSSGKVTKINLMLSSGSPITRWMLRCISLSDYSKRRTSLPVVVGDFGIYSFIFPSYYPDNFAENNIKMCQLTCSGSEGCKWYNYSQYLTFYGSNYDVTTNTQPVFGNIWPVTDLYYEIFTEDSKDISMDYFTPISMPIAIPIPTSTPILTPISTTSTTSTTSTQI